MASSAPPPLAAPAAAAPAAGATPAAAAAAAAAAPPGLAPGLARKVKRILDLKTEAPELAGALATLSAFYDSNAPADRRHLRAAVEARGLEISERFLEAAEAVTAALDAAEAELAELAGAAGAVSDAVAKAKAAGGQELLAESERLAREAAAVEAKAAVVAQFLERHQLTEEEAAALDAGEVGPAFFEALARAREIHDGCRALLRGGRHQRAALELMDAMGRHQERAYEALCRWVQAGARGLGEHDAPEVDPLLAAAVGALRERPVLFKYCAEEVAAARHGALFQRFIVALTRGGPGGVPAPIEIHAHDARRYVADMMAWAHQALAGEREFVAALFGEGEGEGRGAEGAADGGSSGPERQRSGLGQPAAGGNGDAGTDAGAAASADGALTSAALLDRIFEGVCRPLRARVEQVLVMGPPPLLCYQLAQLGAFYHDLVSRALGEGAQLSQALAGCRDMARRALSEQLRAAGDRLLRAPPAPGADLAPPPAVPAALAALREIVAAHESALGGGAADGGEADEDFAPVLAAALDPLLEMCRRSSEALAPDGGARLDDAPAHAAGAAAQPIFLLNCVEAVRAALAPHACCARRAAALADEANALLRQAVRAEAARVLGRCGLGEVAERVRRHRAAAADAAAAGAAPPPPLAADPALSLHAAVEALRAFCALAASGPGAAPEFRLVAAPKLRAEAAARAAAALAEAYEVVYAALEDPASGYPPGAAAGVRHTPAHVRTILGVPAAAAAGAAAGTAAAAAVSSAGQQQQQSGVIE